jgi:hypothetical protein
LIAGVLTVAMILPTLISPPHKHRVSEEAAAGDGVLFDAVPKVDSEA